MRKIVVTLKGVAAILFFTRRFGLIFKIFDKTYKQCMFFSFHVIFRATLFFFFRFDFLDYLDGVDCMYPEKIQIISFFRSLFLSCRVNNVDFEYRTLQACCPSAGKSGTR